MSKKLFVFLSMLIVASMLLAACAQQPAAPAPAETEAPAAPVETEAPAEPAPSGEPIKVG